MFLLLFFLISYVFYCFLTDRFLYFVRNVEWVTLTPSPRWIRVNPYFSFLNSKAWDATDSSNLQLMTLVLLTKVATASTACWHVRLIKLVLFLKGPGCWQRENSANQVKRHYRWEPNVKDISSLCMQIFENWWEHKTSVLKKTLFTAVTSTENILHYAFDALMDYNGLQNSNITEVW